jgi:flagellin-like hook-associated protein FlgL
VASSIAGNLSISFASASSVLGFQDGIYGGFADGRKRSDKMVWGFSKYRPDVVSGEISAIEVGDGRSAVVLNIATALSSGPGLATVADMVCFEDFKSRVNNDLHNAGVAVRLDQVDGAMVFTSLHVGKNNVSESTAYSSMVSIKAVTVTGAVISATRSFLRYFGIAEGSKTGKGDTNFRFHVKHNDNQYHIGANQEEVMKVSFSEMSAAALGVDNLDLTTIEGAEKALGRLNRAIDMVSAERAKLGAYQNRLEYAVNNLRNMHVNASSAESRIRDTDVAQEMIEFTRNQVMKQSATAMLAQANSSSSGILNLLQ